MAAKIKFCLDTYNIDRIVLNRIVIYSKYPW